MTNSEKTGDARLAELEQLWHQGYRRLYADASNEQLERTAAVVEALEQDLANTAAEGYVGLAVKLAVCIEAAEKTLESERPTWLPILRSALEDVQGFVAVIV